MMREISALLGFLTGGGVGSASAVDRCTIWKAAWFTSEGLLLIRLGMVPVCHAAAPFQNESSPLPGPATLASLKEELGPSVVPQSLRDAYEAETIFLAVPFSAHKDVAKQFKRWNGKIVVDLTNAFHVAPEELGGLISSEVVSRAFVGARLVKAFNHLPATRVRLRPPASLRVLERD
jgi:hypothetical protein